jgi:hypothetical protein
MAEEKVVVLAAAVAIPVANLMQVEMAAVSNERRLHHKPIAQAQK